MDEISWQARLAKLNINILGVDDKRWYYEFMYHPRPGQVKWCKTFLEVAQGCDPEVVADILRQRVLELRQELEG